jgi:ubiquinone/menaquinone biosynthesis C-methylase UbiE
MNNSKQTVEDQNKIRRFYNSVYYKNATSGAGSLRHYDRLAAKINVQPEQEVLDVACGTGEWLLAVKARGAIAAGIDLSQKAVEVCKSNITDGEIHAGSAETLPFEDRRFHIVTCLGALEHFINPLKALQEMTRTARDDAVFLLLVPNKDFLTAKLGLFSGTDQHDIKEEVRTLGEWKELFETADLEVIKRWKDLHVLSWSWIRGKKWYHIPLRTAQALALVVWPLSWQYQVYHLCKKKRI